MHYIHFPATAQFDDLLPQIQQAKRIKLSNLRLSDLLIDRKAPHGVYLFFAPDGNVAYVGKAGSRTMLERVASHFDVRPGSWFNSFLSALAGKPKGANPAATELELINVLDKALEHEIVAVLFDSSSMQLINSFESFLMKTYQPPYNSQRRKKVK